MTYKRVTLKEISKKLNLSVSTISAILNNNPNCFASKKTREKVFKVVYELGYKPNLIARSLRKRKTNTIGFIAPILNIGVTLSDIEILEELAWEKGYSLIIGYSKSNPEIEEKILEEFYNRNVDGIILIPTGIKSENNFLKRLLKINFPIVTITKVQGVRTYFVSTSYRKGGYIATEYLIKTGHRKIGFFSGNKNYYTIRERFFGYKKALKRYNLNYCEDFIFEINDDKNLEEIKRISFEIFDKGIDGIFVSNDYISVHLINIAIKNGIKIPDDISVVGFDDSDIAKYSLIPLTTVRQPVEKITKYAFELILNFIEDKKENKRSKYFVPELIIRNSVKMRV